MLRGIAADYGLHRYPLSTNCVSVTVIFKLHYAPYLTILELPLYHGPVGGIIEDSPDLVARVSWSAPAI